MVTWEFTRLNNYFSVWFHLKDLMVSVWRGLLWLQVRLLELLQVKPLPSLCDTFAPLECLALPFQKANCGALTWWISDIHLNVHSFGALILGLCQDDEPIEWHQSDHLLGQFSHSNTGAPLWCQDYILFISFPVSTYTPSSYIVEREHSKNAASLCVSFATSRSSVVTKHPLSGKLA